jgi:hypothetical protein
MELMEASSWSSVRMRITFGRCAAAPGLAVGCPFAVGDATRLGPPPPHALVISARMLRAKMIVRDLMALVWRSS